MKRVASALALCCVCLGSAATVDAATTIPGFRSPSGNISCLLIPSSRSSSMLLCDLARADYSARLQAHCLGPNGGGVDWHGFTLTATRKGALNCSGGILYNPTTERPSYVTLPYGASWHRGAFTCSSRTTGVTCRSRAGHGLFVSRQSWRLW